MAHQEKQAPKTYWRDCLKNNHWIENTICTWKFFRNKLVLQSFKPSQIIESM